MRISRLLLSALVICVVASLTACGDDGTAGSSNNGVPVDTGMMDAGGEEDTSTPDEDTGPEEDTGDDRVPCTSSMDCAAPQVCVIDPATGDRFCGDPVGDKETGESCTDGTECASGLCLNGQCAEPCSTKGDCPAGYTCQTNDVPLSSGGTASIKVCVEEPEPCLSNSDCTDPLVCVADLNGNMVTLTCDDPVGSGGLGDACSSNMDCASNLCVDGSCTAPCEVPNDCATDGTYICDTATISTGGGSATVNVCKPKPPGACSSDADCTSPNRCIATKSATDIEFQCGSPNAGGGETGDTCSDDSDCAQNLCVEGVCAGPCAQDGDCTNATDYTCDLTSVDLGNGNSDNAQICVPPIPCDSSDACKSNETCYVRPAQTSVDVFCRAPNSGGGDLGQICDDGAECLTNLCIDTRFQDVCSKPCALASDCDVAGYECGTYDVPMTGGGTMSVGACVPSDPATCVNESGCQSGRDCAVIENEAGDDLETVCVPTTGGGASGVMCNGNAECASLLCLDGFCAGPCDMNNGNNDCGTNQVCQSTSVMKDGQTTSLDVCVTLPDTQCQSTDDCSSGARVCGELRDDSGTTNAYCAFPNSGGAQMGTTCTTGNMCRERICLNISNECSVICDENSDCNTAGGQICTTYAVENNALGFCNTACTDNDGCIVNPTGKDQGQSCSDGSECKSGICESGQCTYANICTVNDNTRTNDIDQVCMEPFFDNNMMIGKELGESCEQSTDVCRTGLCLSTKIFDGVACSGNDSLCGTGKTCECPVGQTSCADSETECAEVTERCTRLCDDDTDCQGGASGNVLTDCSQSTVIELPDGSGTTTISTCSQPPS